MARGGSPCWRSPPCSSSHPHTAGPWLQVRDLDGPIEPVSLDHRSTRSKENKEAKAAAAAGASGKGEAKAPAEQAAEEQGAAPVKEEQEGAAGAAVKEEGVAEAAGGEAAVTQEVEEEAAEEAAAGKQEADQQPADAAVKQEAEQLPCTPHAGAPAAGEGGAEGEPAGDKPKSWKQRRQEAEEEVPVPQALPEWGARAVGGGKRNRQVRAPCALHPTPRTHAVLPASAPLEPCAAAACSWICTSAGRLCVAAPARCAHPLPPATLRRAAVQGGGGRFRGVDPIVPYVDPEVLSSLRSFYGLAPDCPVPDALVRAARRRSVPCCCFRGDRCCCGCCAAPGWRAQSTPVGPGLLASPVGAPVGLSPAPSPSPATAPPGRPHHPDCAVRGRAPQEAALLRPRREAAAADGLPGAAQGHRGGRQGARAPGLQGEAQGGGGGGGAGHSATSMVLHIAVARATTSCRLRPTLTGAQLCAELCTSSGIRAGWSTLLPVAGPRCRCPPADNCHPRPPAGRPGCLRVPPGPGRPARGAALHHQAAAGAHPGRAAAHPGAAPGGRPPPGSLLPAGLRGGWGQKAAAWVPGRPLCRCARMGRGRPEALGPGAVASWPPLCSAPPCRWACPRTSGCT